MLRRAALLAASGLTSAGVVSGVIQDDWEKIIEICRSGKADRYYAIGDAKLVTPTNGAEFYMEYIGTGLDTRSDGLSDPVSTWIVKDPPMSGYYIAPSAFIGSPPKTVSRCLSEAYETMPDVIKNAIIPKERSNGKLENLWIPSSSEVSDGGRYGCRFYSDETRKKSRSWWLQDCTYSSPANSSVNTYAYVTSTGSMSSANGMNNSMGVIFGICI